MKIMQLSLFVENKPGHLLAPCRLLADNHIDLRALSVADTQQFGILRLIVAEPEQAYVLLDRNGFVVKTNEVVAVEVEVAVEPIGIFSNGQHPLLFIAFLKYSCGFLSINHTLSNHRNILLYHNVILYRNLWR